MKRSDKQELVSNLQGIFNKNNTVMVFHYKGITVAEMDSLRKEAKKLEVGCKIVKNSLASIALKDTQNQVLEEFLEGPSAIAWSNDPLSCAKLLHNYAKANQKLQIIGGTYNGSKLSKEDIHSLAILPSIDAIRSKIVGLLVANATKISIITRTPATNMIGLLQAYSKKS